MKCFTTRSTRRRALLAGIALGPLLAPWRSYGTEDELTRLFSELGKQRERRARFVERRFSALLKAPAESSGVLVYRAPDVLERQTLAPKRETVRIEGNTVTYEGTLRDTVQKHTFALTDAPPLAALIESLRSTLAGDLPALRRHYEVTWSANSSAGGQGWQITLTPRDRQLRNEVSKVMLRGSGGEVATVEIVEASGDLTLLTLTPLPAASVSPAAKK